MATYSISKIKTFNGREGQGLNATIIKDGKPIAFVMDDASGGEVDLDFTNPLQNGASFEKHRANAKQEMAECAVFCRKWYVESGAQARDLAMYAEWDKADKEAGRTSASREEESDEDVIVSWVNNFVDAYQAKKSLDRMAKKKTLFRIADEKYADGEWRTLKRPYDAEVQKYFDRKYPGKVTAIYGVTV